MHGNKQTLPELQPFVKDAETSHRKDLLKAVHPETTLDRDTLVVEGGVQGYRSMVTCVAVGPCFGVQISSLSLPLHL